MICYLSSLFYLDPLYLASLFGTNLVIPIYKKVWHMMFIQTSLERVKVSNIKGEGSRGVGSSEDQMVQIGSTAPTGLPLHFARLPISGLILLIPRDRGNRAAVAAVSP